MKIRFLLICLLAGSASVAQNQLKGTWVMQTKEHLTGPDYENAIPKQITLHQEGDSLIIESIFIEDGQDSPNRQAVAMNGHPASKMGAKSNRKYVRSLKWNDDKKGFVFTTLIYLPDNQTEIDLTRVETLNLTPDGKQLTLHKKSVETQSENWESKAVYVRKLVSD